MATKYRVRCEDRYREHSAKRMGPSVRALVLFSDHAHALVITLGAFACVAAFMKYPSSYGIVAWLTD